MLWPYYSIGHTNTRSKQPTIVLQSLLLWGRGVSEAQQPECCECNGRKRTICAPSTMTRRHFYLRQNGLLVLLPYEASTCYPPMFHLADWSERRHVVSGGKDVADIPAVHHRYQPLPADLFDHQNIGTSNHWDDKPSQHQKPWNITTSEYQTIGTCKTLEHQYTDLSQDWNIETLETAKHWNMQKIGTCIILKRQTVQRKKYRNIKTLEEHGNSTGRARDFRGVDGAGESLERPPPTSLPNGIAMTSTGPIRIRL